ncbi:glycosyltransferase [Cereibacter johrii]|uniref:glycosyltransferase n=1 Tax=Cereibacter johrii TaxID=445629 RepID=UPI0011BE8651|nr:glycosyltransferase [Cereibacter johrii]
MLNEVRTLAAELKCQNSFRVTFALAPFHGSDREVGWNALEADRNAGRKVTYITTRADFRTIASHFPSSDHGRTGAVLEFETVRVVAWPFDLPRRLVPVGYVRFFFWVVLLQLFMAARSCPAGRKKVHFLTYTQLATPILLPKAFDIFHGPAGMIPLIPWRSPCPTALVLKSQLMWQVIMPVVSFLRRHKRVRGTVVHPSLSAALAGKGTGQIDVLSALNVDYLSDLPPPDPSREKLYDAIAVGRDIPIKNMGLIAEAFRQAGARHPLSFLIINGSLPSDYREERGGTTVLGRQDRSVVAGYLQRSRLHVMLSLELGGYINLEAASYEVPTLCLDGFGASQMLSPTGPYRISLEDLEAGTIAERLVGVLMDASKLRQEGSKQKSSAQRFIEDNRQKFSRWLRETV